MHHQVFGVMLQSQNELSKHGAACHGVFFKAYRIMPASTMHEWFAASHRSGLSYLNQMLLC